MSKYGFEAQEKAYDLHIMQQLPFGTVIKRMREEYPTFSKGTLTKWRSCNKLDWAGRYSKHCQALVRQNEKNALVHLKPIADTVTEMREKVYKKIIEALDNTENVITEKNIGKVIAGFSRLVDQELLLTGGKKDDAPMRQVVMILINVIENDPNMGPLFKVHKAGIIDAVFEEIKGDS